MLLYTIFIINIIIIIIVIIIIIIAFVTASTPSDGLQFQHLRIVFGLFKMQDLSGKVEQPIL